MRNSVIKSTVISLQYKIFRHCLILIIFSLLGSITYYFLIERVCEMDLLQSVFFLS